MNPATGAGPSTRGDSRPRDRPLDLRPAGRFFRPWRRPVRPVSSPGRPGTPLMLEDIRHDDDRPSAGLEGLLVAIVESAIDDAMRRRRWNPFFDSPVFAWMLAECGVKESPETCREAIRRRIRDAVSEVRKPDETYRDAPEAGRPMPPGLSVSPVQEPAEDGPEGDHQ